MTRRANLVVSTRLAAATGTVRAVVQAAEVKHVRPRAPN